MSFLMSDFLPLIKVRYTFTAGLFLDAIFLHWKKGMVWKEKIMYSVVEILGALHPNYKI